MDGQHRDDVQTKIAALALACLSIAAPLFLGGVTPSMELAILGLSCAVCTYVLLALRDQRRLGSVPWAAAAALLLVVWTTLQIMPLPARLASWAWPDRFAFMAELQQLHVAPGAWSISVAPGSTHVAIALAAVLAAVLLSATAVARAGHQWLLACGVGLSSSVMACIALLHAIFAADKVFGVYAPQHAKPGLLLAPLLNGNNLAGHLALGFPVTVCLGLESKRVDRRFVWFTLAFIQLTAGVFTLSRGGMAALFLGGTGYLIVHFMRRRQRRKRRASTPTWPAIVMALGVASTGYLGVDLLAREFSDTQSAHSKLSMFFDFVPLVRDHWLVGVGRGAFGDVSPSVLPGNARALYAENMLLHWSVEWGVPATGGALTLLLMSAIATRLRRPIEWALAAGVVSVALQNMVDFSLELAGVAVVFAVALGAVMRTENPARVVPVRAVQRLGLGRLKPACSVAITAAVVSTGTAIPWLTYLSRPTLRSQLEQSLAKPQADGLPPALPSALANYPADPVFLILGAAHAVARNTRTAPSWLNLSMSVAPMWPGPHAQAAHWLERQGRLDQAAGELGMLTGRDAELGNKLSCAFIKRHPSASLALSAAPDGPHHLPALQNLGQCLLAQNRHGEAEALLARVIELYPRSVVARETLIASAMSTGQAQLAIQRAVEMRTAIPEAPSGLAALIHALTRSGQSDRAMSTFRAANESMRGDSRVLWSAAEAAAASHDVAFLDKAVEELVALEGHSADQLAGLHASASHWYASAGITPLALSHAQRSFELGGDPAQLERVYTLASGAGLVQVALRAAVEMCHLRHRAETFCSKANSWGTVP